MKNSFFFGLFSWKLPLPGRAAFRILKLAALFYFFPLVSFAAMLSPQVSQFIHSNDPSKKPIIVIYKRDNSFRKADPRVSASPAAVLRAEADGTRPAPSALPVSPEPRGPVDLWLLNGYAVEATPEETRRLAADPRVESLHENFQLRLPDILPQNHRTENVEGNWGLEKSGAKMAREMFGVTGAGVRIGHLDTGLDASHPALQGKLAAWAEFDADGRPVPGSQPHAAGFHGTHTAGILVGNTAGGEPLGVAPDAKLLSALVLNSDGGTFLQVIAGMQWALDPDGNLSTDDGARLLNMSLGANGHYAVFDAVVDRLLEVGVLPVFAIGNGGPGQTTSPGNVRGVLAVGATTEEDTVAYFSGGEEKMGAGQPLLKPEISAPGSGIRSTMPGGTFASYSGTSMATPHVAGAAALLWEANPSMTASQVKDLLMQTSVDIERPGPDERAGSGRLDVLAALSRLRGIPLLRVATNGPHGPVPAVVRIHNTLGSNLRVVHVSPKTGVFCTALPEGDYTVEAAVGLDSPARLPVRMEPGKVKDLKFVLNDAPKTLGVLLVYPNPFKPYERHEAVTFAGLPVDSRVQIYTLSGALVRESGSLPVNEYVWDGRNGDGEPVASGVYYYVASHYDIRSGWTRKKGQLVVIR
ncbi:MAG TPA: S8 family serine peptidase [Elusimicrobiota bacterium]|nr:S8 family serine peptidase [Elusimicrobiota bacterium]